jgi:hypothetical protein
MTLVADMIRTYMFFFKVLGHGNHFDGFLGPCPDNLVMTAQTKNFYILTLLFRQPGYNLAILDMIRHRTMTELTGNSMMHTLEMHFTNIRMTDKTGGIGAVTNWSVDLIHHGVASVMAEFSKGFGQNPGSDVHSSHSNNNQNQDNLNDMAVRFRFVFRHRTPLATNGTNNCFLPFPIILQIIFQFKKSQKIN